MEVVSTSNLVSLETKKKTACNFKHDYAMRSQIGSIYTNIQMHIYKYEAIHESYFMIAEM